ncbi:MAG: hypothetical protein ACI4AE_04170 [Candidatus Cryptobacteroides sp.]
MPEDFSAVIADLLARIERLEKEVAALRTSAPVQADDTPITMDFSDIAGFGPAAPEGDGAVASPDPLTELPQEDSPVEIDLPEVDPDEAPVEIDLPEETPAEAPVEIDLPEEMPGEAPVEIDLPEEMPEEAVPDEPVVEIPAAGPEEDIAFSSLFGEEAPSPAPARKGRRSLSPKEPAPESKKILLDALTDSCPWRHDTPGPEVRELRSAIGLGDKVFFCHSLFRDDNALYQDTIVRLNSMKKLDDAVDYLKETFPEWDWNSDKVYRFMMAVRRKVRG